MKGADQGGGGVSETVVFETKDSQVFCGIQGQTCKLEISYIPGLFFVINLGRMRAFAKRERRKAASSQKLNAAYRDGATLSLFAPNHKEKIMDIVHLLMACSYLVLAMCYCWQAVQHII